MRENETQHEKEIIRRYYERNTQPFDMEAGSDDSPLLIIISTQNMEVSYMHYYDSSIQFQCFSRTLKEHADFNRNARKSIKASSLYMHYSGLVGV